MEQCFHCQQPVLLLPSEAAFFDTYLLDGLEGELILEAEAFGAIHATCLPKSPFHGYWYGRRLWHFRSVLGFEELGRIGNCLLFRNPRAGDYRWLHDSGVIDELNPQDVIKAKRYQDDYIVAVVREFNMEFDRRDVPARVEAALKATKSYPLAAFIEDVGAKNAWLYPELINQGELQVNRSLRRYWGGNNVSCNISSYRFVPAGIMAAIRAREAELSDTKTKSKQ